MKTLSKTYIDEGGRDVRVVVVVREREGDRDATRAHDAFIRSVPPPA